MERPLDGRLRVGVRFEPDWAPEELPAFALWAEEAGYDELWLAEDLPWTGGVAMAATALACTNSLCVGIGLLPVVTRNIATTAMEIATLERIAPGRLTVAMGHGVPAWMGRIGETPNSRLAALEEGVLALRRLLAGEEVTTSGREVQLQGIELGSPSDKPTPILVGTTGSKGLRLAGRCSDGVLLPEITSPDAVRWARGETSAGGESGTTVIYAMVSVDDDRTRALAQIRTRVQRLLDFQIFPKLTDLAGLGADGSLALTDAILQTLAATGTPDDCRRSAEDWAAAGVDRIVLVAGDDDPRTSYERFAADILPTIRETQS